MEEFNEERSSIGVFTPISGNLNRQTSKQDLKYTINEDIKSVQLDNENIDKSENNSFIEPKIKNSTLQRDYAQNSKMLHQRIPFKVQSFVYSSKQTDKEK